MRFPEGFKLIKNGDKYGYKLNGRFVLYAEHELIWPVNNDVVAFRDNGLWGFCTAAGKVEDPIHRSLVVPVDDWMQAQFPKLWLSSSIPIEILLQMIKTTNNGYECNEPCLDDLYLLGCNFKDDYIRMLSEPEQGNKSKIALFDPHGAPISINEYGYIDDITSEGLTIAKEGGLAWVYSVNKLQEISKAYPTDQLYKAGQRLFRQSPEKGLFRFNTEKHDWDHVEE